jgi:hypothetical protein
MQGAWQVAEMQMSTLDKFQIALDSQDNLDSIRGICLRPGVSAPVAVYRSRSQNPFAAPFSTFSKPNYRSSK